MKKLSLEHSSKTNPIVWLIRFILVGILAFAAFRFLQPQTTDTVPGVSTSTATSTMETSTTTIVLVNENAITSLDLNGQAKRMTADEFVAAHPASTWPSGGVQVSNGQWATFHLPAEATSGTRGSAVSLKGAWTAKIISVKTDGASVIQLTDKTKSKELILRQSSGTPIKDASIAGWFDDERMMIIGHATDTKWLYSFSTQGIVQPIVSLPETIVSFQVKDGALWYVTATQGEGIESDPTGPSDVHRVVMSPSIQDTIEHHEDTRVVIGFTGTQPLAFTLDNGESFWKDISIGKRRPLLVLPDQRLIVRDGFDLVLFDPKTGATRKLMATPEGAVTIFVMP